MKKICFVIVLLVMTLNVFSQNAPARKQVNLIFIGNSITYGAGLANPRHDAPPVKCAIYLNQQPTVGQVKFANCGVSGATTFDFLPDSVGLFKNVVDSANKLRDETWATMVFSVMLGTNDSAIRGTRGAPVSKETYAQNIKSIIDRLLALYPNCKIILHRPIWYSPNTYNGSEYLQAGLNRLISYYPVLQDIVIEYSHRFPNQVYLGDTEGFEYFKSHYATDMQAEEGNAWTFYLHPNVQGALHLGELWGKAILRVLMIPQP